MRQGNEYEKIIKKIKKNRDAEIKRLRDTLNTIKQKEQTGNIHKDRTNNKHQSINQQKGDSNFRLNFNNVY